MWKLHSFLTKDWFILKTFKIQYDYVFLGELHARSPIAKQIYPSQKIW